MDKRQRHNLLLILAMAIFLIGVIVQVYLMVKEGHKAEPQNETQTIQQSN